MFVRHKSKFRGVDPKRSSDLAGRESVGGGSNAYSSYEKSSKKERRGNLKSKYKNLDDLVMMIGGNLVVGSGNTGDIVARYKKYGFDIVCHQVDLNTGLDMLAELLQERGIE